MVHTIFFWRGFNNFFLGGGPKLFIYVFTFLPVKKEKIEGPFSAVLLLLFLRGSFGFQSGSD